MQSINWSQFGQKAESKQKSFEDLSMFLCCRSLGITKIEAYQNQPGIESEPFEANGKKHGFQAKFFDTGFDWNQIKSSIDKAINTYPELDRIFIYSNKDRTKNLKENKKTKIEVELENKAKRKGVKLEYITDKEIILKLSSPSNFDLAQLFFGTGDEYGFIKNSTNPNILTLLHSLEYLELPFVDKDKLINNDILSPILASPKKDFLITGHPGSGKSIFMHRSLQVFGGLDKQSEVEMLRVLTSNEAVPILVNLKNCATDSLENILRGRKTDSKINNQELGFIYLFDGLDELNEADADNVLSQIYELNHKTSTKKVIISCRTGNLNKIKARTYFSEVEEYQIANLEETFIDKYFEAKNDASKCLKLEKIKETNSLIIRDIKDIFLIKLLWDTIESLDETSTIIDLFSKKIDLLLETPNHRKNIDELNLPNPKEEAIIKLNQDISYEFQKEFQFRFPQDKLQELILRRFERIDYKSANVILNYLADLFFENSYSGNQEKSISYIYQHRRYQEFFFAQKLKTEYENNPQILRELNVLSNREFFEKLFLKYLRKEYEKENNLPGLIELNLIDVYLGKHKGWGADKFYYLNSSEFIPCLANQSMEVFNELLEDENLWIKDKLELDFETIEIFHRNNKKHLLDSQIKSFKNWFNKTENEHKFNLVYNQFESFLYYKIVLNEEEIEAIFHNLVRASYETFEANLRRFRDGKGTALKSFFHVCLRDRKDELFKLTDLLDEYEFTVLLDVLRTIEYLPFFIQNSEIHQKVKTFVRDFSGQFSEKNSFILFYKKFFNLPISSDEISFAKKEFKRIKMERDIDWKVNRTEIDFSLLSFVLEEYSFCKLLKKHEGYVSRYYREAELYAALFKDFIDLLRQEKSIESIARDYIRYVNLYDRRRGAETLLQYGITTLWINIFANSKASEQTKSMLKNRLLMKENNIIRITFLLRLNLINQQLFTEIINESELSDFENELLNWEEDFQSYVDRCFELAQMFSSLNPDKAISYIAKGINDGILRHGWRKDPIVDWLLVIALEILWKNNWSLREKLREYTLKVFELGKRAAKITDDAGDGPENVLELLSKYDLEFAERLLEDNDEDLINSAISSVLKGKVKRGLPIEEIEKGMDNYTERHDYDGKPYSDYYEQKFSVYLSIAICDFYTDEDKQEAFEKACNQVKEMQVLGLKSYLGDRYFKDDKLTFKRLCEKYGKEFTLSFEENEEAENERKSKIAEERFIKDVKKATTEKKIKGLYKSLSNYQNGIVLSKPESWETLINKTWEVLGSIELFTEYLKENYFPHIFWTANSKYFDLALAIALKNINTRQEMLKYLFRNTGHSGFVSVMKAYELNNDKKMCVTLFERYLKFCDFILN